MSMNLVGNHEVWQTEANVTMYLSGDQTQIYTWTI